MIYVRLTQRAVDELEHSAMAYEAISKSLGVRFVNEVDSIIKTIASSPKLYQVVYSKYRAAHLKRFPFSVFYTLEEEGAVIHAVFDSRQDPAKRP